MIRKVQMNLTMTGCEIPRKIKIRTKEIRKIRKNRIPLVIHRDQADPYVSCLVGEMEAAVLIPQHVAVHVLIACRANLNLA